MTVHAAPDADPRDIDLSNVFFIVLATNNQPEAKDVNKASTGYGYRHSGFSMIGHQRGHADQMASLLIHLGICAAIELPPYLQLRITVHAPLRA